ncbi:LysR family transcriptional regulator [Arthrobacter sp. CJ23]|uniref:LysR family transcriptional regulator n=1 Tax=Arthrobacter sp. CJ23 TaxID=2972479 RepID=UPI00215C13A5|nr:LysR family transcriptional regulator [Arthrobacter sp. CJ23]UVJ39899.1 LysR family transcriptional regulator [Arthrobacter sp. CJ23]
MSVELRQLRCLVAVVEEGTFTDAAIELRMSQAAVSRNIAALEQTLGARLVERTTRSVGLTPGGERVLAKARRILSLLEDLEREARAGAGKIRIGYAWSALGEHTTEFQRRWAATFADTELQLIRSNSPTAGLTDGTTDFAILRRLPEAAAVGHVRIGAERRYCAMSSEDPLAPRRSVTLAQVAERPLAVDVRTGSTTLELWPEHGRPQEVIAISDIDDWLTLIGSGKARGITAESTAHQYRRRGVVYRPVRDAPPVPVYAAWSTKDPPREREQIVELLAGLYGLVRIPPD